MNVFKNILLRQITAMVSVLASSTLGCTIDQIKAKNMKLVFYASLLSMLH
jgi:hypothetical protein